MTDAPRGRGRPKKKVPPEIVARFRAVTSADELLEIDRELAALLSEGVIAVRMVESLLQLSREIRLVLEEAAKSRAVEVFPKLVLMTLDEVEAFKSMRAARAPRALAPGEGVPPPGGASA